MDYPVLLVDDEANILSAFKRGLHKEVSLDVAQSADETLKLMQSKNYAIIVADMQMPNMDGLTLLQKVKERSPDSVRMMLTGNTDQKTSVDAINHADIFRFINKPCSSSELLIHLKSALKMYELVVAERILLDKTLKSTIHLLNEVLSLSNPKISRYNSQILLYMKRLASEIKLKPHWSFDSMIQLSQLGYLTLNSQYFNIHQSKAHTMNTKTLWRSVLLSHSFINKIPRMTKLAKNILYQEKCFNGAGYPEDNIKGKEIPIGARMLKIVATYVRLEMSGIESADALIELNKNPEYYDPELLPLMSHIVEYEREMYIININQLKSGMVIEDDIYTLKGQLIATKGQTVSETMLNIISSCFENNVISGDIKVSYLETKPSN
ncbi:response regulator [Vibrio sp.]|nr:response regulator [Vibrio sp.]